MNCYRSDRRGRFQHFINHQPHIVAIIVLAFGLPLVWWLANVLP